MQGEIAVIVIVFLVPLTTAIRVCPNDTLPTITTELGYSLDRAERLFCPDTDSAVERWVVRVNSSGTFSSNSTFSSDDAFCSNDQFKGTVEPCMMTTSDHSYLLICVAGVVPDSGTLEFTFNPTNGTPDPFTIMYAPFGITLLNNRVINTYLGGQVEITWRVHLPMMVTESFQLFHITNTTKELFTNFGDTDLDGTMISLFLNPHCQNSMENRQPSDYTLSFDDVRFAVAGVYMLNVIVPSSTEFYSSNITLNVLSSTTTALTSTPTGGLSSEVPPSHTPSPNVGPGNGSHLVIVIAVGVVAAVALPSLVMIVIVICIVMRKRRRSKKTNLTNAKHNGSSPAKYNKNRSSVGSDQPLVRTTPSPKTTPTSKTRDDYVSVYYEQEYANSYNIFRHKYPDRVRELSDIDSLILAMADTKCIEIIVLADCRHSQVFTEMQSRSLPAEGRSKVKWVVFQKDSTPGFNLEFQGYRMVVLEGDPQEEDTFSELLMKLEQAVYRSAPSPVEHHKRIHSDPVPQHPTIHEERPQGHSETDYHTTTFDRRTQEGDVSLPVQLAKVAKLMEKSVELTEANLEENKKHGLILKDIGKSTAGTKQNTGEMRDTLELALLVEGENSPP